MRAREVLGVDGGDQAQSEVEHDSSPKQVEPEMPHGIDTVEESPLACAARRRDLFQVQALLRDRADPQEKNDVGETPLLQAAALGDLDILALLLGHRADPAEIAPMGPGSKQDRFGSSVSLLCDIFADRQTSCDARRQLLVSLDPGAHAQVRTYLRLGERKLAFLKNSLSPAECMVGKPVRELDSTANHQVVLHMADSVRPVLVLSPLWEKPAATVLLLHGILQSGRMLERLARNLSRNLPHVQFVAPTARTQESIFGIGPSWHGVVRPDDFGNILLELEQARTELLDLLEIDSFRVARRVVLAGFSQGGTMAVWTALQSARSFSGLLLFGIPDCTHLVEYMPAPVNAQATMPVLQIHGSDDSIIPPVGAGAGAESLRRSGLQVQYSLHEGIGHTISDSMVVEARDWLSAQLSPVQTDVAPAPAQQQSRSRKPRWAELAKMKASVSPGQTTAEVFDIADDSNTSDTEVASEGLDLNAMFQFAAESAAGSDSVAGGIDRISRGEAVGDRRAVSTEPPLIEDADSIASLRLEPDWIEDIEMDPIPGSGELAGAAPKFDAPAAASALAAAIAAAAASPPVTGADLRDGGSLLAYAASQGDLREVKRLLRGKAEPDAFDSGGEPPLFGAVRSGHCDVVATLLLGKCTPSLRSAHGTKAVDLVSAGASSDKSMTEALLRLACCKSVRAQEQRSAFDVLEECTRFLVARRLELLGAQLAVSDVLSSSEWEAACRTQGEVN